MNDTLKITTTWIGAIILGIVLIFSVWYVSKKISIWSASMSGQAELAQADWNRQIAVREAKAKEESAALLAQAEVIRAQGVAKANQIIGQSLEHNESYLKYLWIQNLQNEKNQIIYVPTEANLPILEATRTIKGKTNYSGTK